MIILKQKSRGIEEKACCNILNCLLEQMQVHLPSF